ncbi:hypothetical protein HDU96_009264 [Phlyctochytrium bullatum]|nr:hypothetical protein HDU96_009264 [Phlyctochytrium bullatum]
MITFLRTNRIRNPPKTAAKKKLEDFVGELYGHDYMYDKGHAAQQQQSSPAVDSKVLLEDVDDAMVSLSSPLPPHPTFLRRTPYHRTLPKPSTAAAIEALDSVAHIEDPAAQAYPPLLKLRFDEATQKEHLLHEQSRRSLRAHKKQQHHGGAKSRRVSYVVRKGDEDAGEGPLDRRRSRAFSVPAVPPLHALLSRAVDTPVVAPPNPLSSIPSPPILPPHRSNSDGHLAGPALASVTVTPPTIPPAAFPTPKCTPTTTTKTLSSEVVGIRALPESLRSDALFRIGSLSSSSLVEELMEHSPWSFAIRPPVAKGDDELEMVATGGFDTRKKGEKKRRPDAAVSRSGELGPWTQHGPPTAQPPAPAPLGGSMVPPSEPEKPANPTAPPPTSHPVDPSLLATKPKLRRFPLRVVPVHGGRQGRGISGPCEKDRCGGVPVGTATSREGDRYLTYRIDHPDEPAITDDELRKATLRADRICHFITHPTTLTHRDDDHGLDFNVPLWLGKRPATSHAHPARNPLVGPERLPGVMGEPQGGHYRTKRLSAMKETTVPLLRSGEGWAVVNQLPSEGVSKGVANLIDRGFVPPSSDLTPILRPSKCLRTKPAPLHYTDESDEVTFYHPHVDYRLPAIFEASPLTACAQERIPSPGPDYRTSRKRKMEERNWKAEKGFSEKYKILEIAPRLATDADDEEEPRPREKPAASLPPPDPFAGAYLKAPPCPPPSIAPECESVRANTEAFTIVIRFGEISTESPAFRNLQNKYSQNWTQIGYTLKKVSRLLSLYSLPWVEIKISKLLEFALELPFPRTSLFLHDVRAMIANDAIVDPVLLDPGRRYINDANREETAATRIRANWLAYTHRKIFEHHMKCRKAALTIVRMWKYKMHRRILAATIRTRFEVLHMKRYHRLMAFLRREWVHIEARKRFVILLAPKAYEVEDFEVVIGK